MRLLRLGNIRLQECKVSICTRASGLVVGSRCLGGLDLRGLGRLVGRKLSRKILRKSGRLGGRGSREVLDGAYVGILGLSWYPIPVSTLCA